MPSYVAFLRAINIGGRQIKMEQLTEHFQTLGHEGAQTFIKTGNVIFQDVAQASTELEEQLENPIEELLGFRSEVFVRDASELQAILETAATIQSQVPNSGELNIVFLKEPLTETQALTLDNLSSDNDTFHIQGKEVYWTCQTATNASKISNGILESKLKLRSTLRPAAMLTELSEKFFP